MELPWETPVSSVFGKPLAGIAVGVQTMLDVAPVHPVTRFARIFDQVAVSFLASAGKTEVVVEVHKRVRVTLSRR